MYRSLKERGRAAADYYTCRPEYFSLSPAGLSLLKALQPLVEAHCRGRVLDAGTGRGAYRQLLSRFAERCVGMDMVTTAATDLLGDVQRLPFADGSFDTVFFSQVLEHVPEPGLTLAEFWRVLKPGQYLILSVPHISWLHNEPHDYYRYTLPSLSVFAGTGQLWTGRDHGSQGTTGSAKPYPFSGSVKSDFWQTVFASHCFGDQFRLGAADPFSRCQGGKHKVFAPNYVFLTKKI